MGLFAFPLARARDCTLPRTRYPLIFLQLDSEVGYPGHSGFGYLKQQYPAKSLFRLGVTCYSWSFAYL